MYVSTWCIQESNQSLLPTSPTMNIFVSWACHATIPVSLQTSARDLRYPRKLKKHPHIVVGTLQYAMPDLTRAFGPRKECQIWS